jgi:hypothetical protein
MSTAFGKGRPGFRESPLSKTRTTTTTPDTRIIKIPTTRPSLSRKGGTSQMRRRQP